MDHVLGLDLGTVTLGVALSKTGIISSGYEEFRFPDREWHIALQEVVRIVKLEGIKEIALGLPLNMNGSESEMSSLCRSFGEMINKELPDIKLVLIDEMWTTKAANRSLLEMDVSRKRRKEVVDKVAAQGILDTYLERGF